MTLVLSREAWADGSAQRWLEERRSECGVIPLGENRFAVISHRAAVEVLTDSRRFTSRFGTGPHHVEVPGASLNLSDPPRSTRLRRLLSIESLSAAALERRARELLDARPVELVGGFAQPLALFAFGQLFGIEDLSALEEIGRLTRALPRAADAAAFSRADSELLAFLRARPSMFGVTLENDQDRLYLQRLIAQTGHESTAMTIALALELLSAIPSPASGRGQGEGLRGATAQTQREQATAHIRTLTPTPLPLAGEGINELLRVTSVLIRFAREATTDTQLNGIDIPNGARLLVFFPLVNRDPAVFEKPDEVRFDRTPNPHLTFGAGSHACFGADVARTVLNAALQAFGALPKPPKLISATPLVSAVTRGLESLHIEY